MDSSIKRSTEIFEKVDEQEKERRLKLIVFRTIVQLTDTVNTEFLLQKLNYLDVNSWLEVVEERHIGRLCGFPCCSNAVQLKRYQKYRIDRKNKKVYERCTDRDRFCSEECFVQSSYIREQLFDQPLWLRGLQKQKTFSLTCVVRQQPPINKKTDIEYVEERVEKQLSELIVGVSNDTDEDDESFDEVRRKKDDLFVNELSDYLFQRLEISKAQHASCSSVAGSVTSKSACVELPLNCNEFGDVHSFTVSSQPTLSNSEKLAKIRVKYAINKGSRGPPLIEAKPLNVSLAKKVGNFEAGILHNLIKEYCGEKTLNFLRNGKDYFSLNEEGMMEAKEFVQKSFTGDGFVDEKTDDVVLPHIDDANQQTLRIDIFARFMKPSFRLLESKLQIGGLYEKALPLINTLTLSATNIDIKKPEACIFVAFLFQLFFVDKRRYNFGLKCKDYLYLKLLKVCSEEKWYLSFDAMINALERLTIGHFIFSMNAFVIVYIAVWIFVVPFFPSESFLHLAFLHQYYALLIPSVCFTAAICLVGFFAALLFTYHWFGGECLVDEGVVNNEERS